MSFHSSPDRVSSIPIVDDNGSLHDVYSLRFAYCNIYFCHAAILFCFLVLPLAKSIGAFDLQSSMHIFDH